MRRRLSLGFSLFILMLLMVLQVSRPAFAAPYPVYITLSEEMSLRRFLKPGDPGYKDDGALRLNPGLEALPKGTIIELASNYNSNATKQLKYFRKDLRSDKTKFIKGFKILYAPGLTAEQLTSLNSSSQELHLIRSSVRKYSSTRTKPTIPGPAVVAETQEAPPVKVVNEVEEASQVATATGAATPSAPTLATASTKPVFIQTNDKLAMRVPKDDGTLGSAERFLPKGSVIKISEGALENGSNFSFEGGKGAKRDFISGFEVVSAPGMNAEQVAALNSKSYYMAQSFVKEGDVIADPSVSRLADIASEGNTEAAAVDSVDECTDGDCGSAKPTAPAPITVADGPCAGLPAELVAACTKFLGDKSIPQDALAWTLDVFKNNLNGLKMNKCILNPPTDHYSVPNDFTKKTLQGGIKNKCQIMINDTRKKHEGFQFRGTYHFINLCTGDKRTGYFNMGTGTFRNKYANKGGKKTTVLGAFLTADDDFLYNPSERAYRAIKKKGVKGVPALALFGLQNTNNQSANSYKYIHVSPYRSSWGCPSIAAKDGDLISKLADNGPSLVVNYGPESNMEDPSKCTPK